MRLTRRDALIAASAAGLTGIGGYAIAESPTRANGREMLVRTDIETLLGVAEVVYPSEIRGHREFVETYVSHLHVSRRRAITATIDDLDHAVSHRHGRSFGRFDTPQQEEILRSLGVHRVESDPDGTVPERVRAYLVNGLLYALFTTPTGAGLFGIDNPLGYPGGYESVLRWSA